MFGKDRRRPTGAEVMNQEAQSLVSITEAGGHEMTTKLSTECHWSQDGEDSDIWAAQCGRYFTTNDGSPSDNEMRFCCFCGKPLVEIRFEDEHE